MSRPPLTIATITTITTSRFRCGRAGDWRADPAKCLNGLGAVGEVRQRHGIDSIVWFEPERVHPGTPLFTEHPEWLLRFGPDSCGSALLDLAEMRWAVPSAMVCSGANCWSVVAVGTAGPQSMLVVRGR